MFKTVAAVAIGLSPGIIIFCASISSQSTYSIYDDECFQIRLTPDHNTVITIITVFNNDLSLTLTLM